MRSARGLLSGEPRLALFEERRDSFFVILGFVRQCLERGRELEHVDGRPHESKLVALRVDADSRAVFDALTGDPELLLFSLQGGVHQKDIQTFGAGGLVWAFVQDDGTWRSPIAKFLSADEIAAVTAALGASPGDLLLAVADTADTAAAALGALRLELSRRWDLVPQGDTLQREIYPPMLDALRAAQRLERKFADFRLAGDDDPGVGERAEPTGETIPFGPSAPIRRK